MIYQTEELFHVHFFRLSTLLSVLYVSFFFIYLKRIYEKDDNVDKRKKNVYERVLQFDKTF